MFTYGRWDYEELRNRIGVRPGKHHPGDKEDSYIALETPFDGTYLVKASSFRLDLFRKDPRCVACHRIGSVWLLQAHHDGERPHLNLFHQETEELTEWKNLVVDGLVLMTKDHIIPKSAGGPTNLENLQVMCSICNAKKGATIPDKHVKVLNESQRQS